MFKGVSNWAPYWQFHFGEGWGGTSAGRSEKCKVYGQWLVEHRCREWTAVLKSNPSFPYCKEMLKKQPMMSVEWTLFMSVYMCPNINGCHISGLYGKTDLDQLRIDMIIDSIDDLISKLLVIFSAESDEAKVTF